MGLQQWGSVNSNNALSNNNLTATHTAAQSTMCSGYGSEAVVSGKYYWETTLSGQFFSAESTGVGIAANGSSTTTGNGIGWNTAGTVGYYTTGSHGAIIYNNAQQLSVQVLTSPALICHALDLTNNKYWVRAGVSG